MTLVVAVAAGSAIEGRLLNKRMRLLVVLAHQPAGMAPPKYKDLGKQANDILNEDFKFEHSLELKSKLNGVEVKSTFADKGKNGLTGEIEVRHPLAASNLPRLTGVSCAWGRTAHREQRMQRADYCRCVRVVTVQEVRPFWRRDFQD